MSLTCRIRICIQTGSPGDLCPLKHNPSQRRAEKKPNTSGWSNRTEETEKKGAERERRPGAWRASAALCRGPREVRDYSQDSQKGKDVGCMGLGER